jgi:SAM-dependent methyltransferase
VQAEPWVAKWSALTRFVRRAVLPNRNRLFAMARAVLPRGTSLTLLDVGCGTGSLLADIARRYARLGIAVVPLGIEISRHLAAVSGAAYAALGGKVVFAGAVDGMSEFPPESLDGIFLSSFLEHEAQPLRLLRETRRALKTAGAIVLKVPNYACWNRLLRGRRWCGYRFPDHVNYFTPRTLAILATEAGFVVARQNFLDRLPLSDSMYAVLRKKA